MSTQTRSRKKPPPAWWLESGEEECPHCQRAYVYEAQVRCADCDEAMCPLCVVWTRERSVCAGCAPSPGVKR